MKWSFSISRNTDSLVMKSKTSPAVSRLPSEGGTEDILSTREGGAIGTIVGTPVTKYGGYAGVWGVEVPVFIPLPASYTAETTHNPTHTSTLSNRVSVPSANFCISVCVCVCVGVFTLTVPGAAACVRAAPAADVTAAGVRTTLTPTNADQQQEQDTAERHRSHEHPLCKYTQHTILHINKH